MGFPDSLESVDWEEYKERGYTKETMAFPSYTCPECGHDEFTVFVDGRGVRQATYCQDCGTRTD